MITENSEVWWYVPWNRVSRSNFHYTILSWILFRCDIVSTDRGTVYMCNNIQKTHFYKTQISPLKLLQMWLEPRSWRGLLNATLYAIKFVSDLRQVGGFLQVLRFHPQIKSTTTISETYCWKLRWTPWPQPYVVIILPLLLTCHKMLRNISLGFHNNYSIMSLSLIDTHILFYRKIWINFL